MKDETRNNLSSQYKYRMNVIIVLSEREFSFSHIIMKPKRINYYVIIELRGKSRR